MGPLSLNLARKQVKSPTLMFILIVFTCDVLFFTLSYFSFSFCFVFSLGCAPVLVPAKVIHALNLNINDFNGGRQPRFSNDFGVDYGELVYNEKNLIKLNFEV